MHYILLALRQPLHGYSVMTYVQELSLGQVQIAAGARSEGKKVVVIEDLISTGGSSITAVEALQEAGAEVLGVVAIFTYGLNKAGETFKAAGVPFYT
ncbi:phosphoribosyltransferase family protein, partial [Staphylococcus pseudintermedius]|uniref:phosphoribosyltransferase family protein n=1 Tax=Staphylococcus pseudintermedius TaxID=283734 RepID=UPI00237B81FD